MSHYIHRESTATLAARPSFPWRTFFNNAAEVVGTWFRRRQQRQELRDYMAIDHRAAADMGVSANDARDWAERPFWRP
jgi:uncharacterized protein YjiS (DUF1127 family)